MTRTLGSPARALAVILACLLSGSAWANGENGHSDPIAPVILGVTAILFFAILGRFAARKFNQPEVVGNLLMGIVIGHFGYLYGIDLVILLREVPQIFDIMNGVATTAMFDGETAQMLNRVLNSPRGAERLQVAHVVDVFSRYGVIFLLFMVGLESSVEEMRNVGADSARVALIGVAMPFALGFAAVFFLMPGANANTQLFVAATLGATSVGITASVLEELGKGDSHEGRIILGAAVMDDILGLVLLAIVSGIIVSGGVDVFNVLRIIGLSLGFLIGAVYVGPYMLRVTIHALSRFDLVEAMMFTSFLFVMALAWIANLVGLATIVGAFTAGLILRDSYFEDVFHPHEHVSIRDLILPLEVIFVPIFFMLMGMQVKLEKLTDPTVLVLATGLLAAAIVGKILCGLGANKDSNRLAIGFGMLPRGEVGLIFASIGKTLGVINDTLFSAIIMMVIVTTLMAPELLTWSLRDRKPQQAE